MRERERMEAIRELCPSTGQLVKMMGETCVSGLWPMVMPARSDQPKGKASDNTVGNRVDPTT
jgi:hypothetical protein